MTAQEHRLEALVVEIGEEFMPLRRVAIEMQIILLSGFLGVLRLPRALLARLERLEARR